MSKHYMHIVSTILEVHDIETLPVNNLLASLQSHEDLFTDNSEPIDHLLHTKMNLQNKSSDQPRDSQPKEKQNTKNQLANYQPRNNNNERHNQPKNHQEKPNQHKNSHFHRGNQERNQNRSCIICKKTNHYTKDCYYRCRRCKNPNHSDGRCWYRNSSEQTATADSDQREFLFTRHTFSAPQDIGTWFIDSGTSRHMVHRRYFFIELDEEYKGEVYLGDEKKERVEGRGTIAVKSSTETQ